MDDPMHSAGGQWRTINLHGTECRRRSFAAQ